MSFAQGWNTQHEFIQPVIKIFPELSSPYTFIEIIIRRRNDPNVHIEFLYYFQSG